MRAPVKLLLGFVAVLPIVASAAFMGTFIYLIQTDATVLFEWIVGHELLLLFINLVLMLVTYGPIVFYIIHAGRNPGLADRRAVWIILMVIFGAFVTPVYWYRFIWQQGYYES